MSLYQNLILGSPTIVRMKEFNPFFVFYVRGTKMRIEESRPKERKQSILEKREFVLKSTLPLKEVSWGGRSLRGNDLKY